MSFMIGIGVLLEEAATNRLRQFELRLAKESGNWSALRQPPHITVKVPFPVNSTADIDKVSGIMAALAERTDNFEIELQGFGNFGDTTLYAAVKNTHELLNLSDQLIEEFTEPGEAREREQRRMIFHSTVAKDLGTKEYEKARKYLQHESLALKARAQGLGLFLGIDNLQHWVVISEAPFKNI
ncbi:MAG TPA: 2'-5' RNA ligase family protein [Candidatus Saccharimonadales bacterium]|nr:2'-5' RNA ligase family protein [Candidatus Saccharimonadales bacterium]